MKLYRYMSVDEFHKAVDLGLPMINKNQFRLNRTNSEGFCFLAEKTLIKEKVYSPEECYWFLKGIVTAQVLVEFDAPRELVRESWGIYGDPEYYWNGSVDYSATVEVQEFCTRSYTCEDFIPLRYAPVDAREVGVGAVGEWYEIR